MILSVKFWAHILRSTFLELILWAVTSSNVNKKAISNICLNITKTKYIQIFFKRTIFITIHTVCGFVHITNLYHCRVFLTKYGFWSNFQSLGIINKSSQTHTSYYISSIMILCERSNWGFGMFFLIHLFFQNH